MGSQGSGRVALVTGGGGDIGRVTAMEFARRGYRVAVCDINGERARDCAEQIREAGGTASWHGADISSKEQVVSLVGSIVAAHGSLDVAFNNAGISGGRIAVADAEEEDFDRCIEVNLKGTWLCMKYQIRQMLEQGRGAIVNNCSVTGLRGSVGVAYCASKHGIAGLTQSAALVYAGKNIRVNAVCPGLIDAGLGAKLIERFSDRPHLLTMQIPAGHAGTELDVARAVCWLSSDEASFTHGHLLTVDGGYNAH